MAVIAFAALVVVAPLTVPLRDEGEPVLEGRDFPARGGDMPDGHLEGCHITFKDAIGRDVMIPLSFGGLEQALDAPAKERS